MTQSWGGSLSRIHRYDDESSCAPEYLQSVQCERRSLKTTAAKLHWQIVSPPSLRGRSGVTHRFDFVATRGKDSLVFDICEQPSETDVIKTFIKKLDTGASACIICLTRKMTQEASKLAAEYGLKVLRSDNIESAFRARRMRLRSEGAGCPRRN